MDYDLWKTGWYDTEPDVDYDDYCSHKHCENRRAVEELIEALYAPEGLNLDFIQEQLESLAEDYHIDFNFNRPLNLKRDVEPSSLNLKPTRNLYDATSRLPYAG
ncbi:hypothetical protein SCG7086_AI_00160 [Chlamydiales bacterium SCGC AG-110-P3]|nr:hypothetical protein SCG7086_AI_00160 [Chlamydiales bacterium SCGC AG-110-P3]